MTAPVQTDEAAARIPVTSVLLLGGILALSVVLDLFRLGARSLWFDETVSVAFAHLPWTTLATVLWHGEANMALYYGLLHLWVGVFGDSEFGIRMLSALMAVGAVAALYVLGARMFDRRVGLICALLIAVNAYHIAYGQEARSYSLLVLLVTLSSLAFLRTLERPSRTNILLYTVTSVLSVYTHFFAALVLAAQWLSLALLKPRPRVRKAIFGAAAVIGLLLVPLVIVAMAHPNEADWQPRPTPRAVLDLFYALTGSSPGRYATLLLRAYFVACVGALIVGIKRFSVAPFSFSAWRYGFLLVWLVAPVALALGISIIKPIFISYYLIILLPPLVLLAGVGISKIPVESGVALALCIFVAMAANEDAHYFISPGREDWRGATQYAASRFRPGDGFVFSPAYLKTPFDYYRVRVFPAGEPLVTAFPWHRSWPRAAGEPTEQQLPDTVLRSLPSHYSRIWLFSRGEPIGPTLLARLRADYAAAGERSFGWVRVALYSRARAAIVPEPGAH
jgi:mannosyltransferase